MAGSGANAGTAYVDVKPDLTGFTSQLSAGVLGATKAAEMPAKKGMGRALAAGVGAAAGMAVASAGIIGIGASIAGLVNVGMTYEDTMLKFKAVTGASADVMAKAAEIAQRLGSDITLPGVSAADAASAMTELAKAGMSTEDAMKAVEGTMRLAIAAQVDAGTAAIYQSSALNAFNLKGKDAAMVADLLAAGANASAAEIGDMAQAMQMSASMFGASKVPIQDLVAQIGLMANAGIRGSDAGTSLKTMLMRLTSPSKEAAKKMKELGISVFDANGQMRPFESIVGDFGVALAKMNPQQRAATMNMLFGADAARAANIVLGAGVDKYKAMAGAVTESGAAQKVAGATTTGLSGAVDALMSNVEGLAINLYNRLAPGLTVVVRGLAEFVGNLQPLFDLIINIVSAVADWVAQNDWLIGVLASLTAGIIAFKVATAAAAIVTNLYGTAIMLWQAKALIAQVVSMGLTGAVSALNAAMMANPIGLIIALIAALVVAFLWLWNNNEGFRNFILGMWESIQAIVKTVVDWFKNEALPKIKAFIDGAVKFFQALWDGLKVAFDKIASFIKIWVKVVTFPIRMAVTIIWAVVSWLWKKIGPFITEKMNAVKKVITVTWAIITTVFRNVMKAIWSVIQSVWSKIHPFIARIVASVKAVIQAHVTAILGVWQRITQVWTVVQSAFSKVASVIGGFVGVIAGKVSSIVSAITGPIFGIASTLYNAGRDTIQGFINGVMGMAGTLRDAIMGFIRANVPGPVLSVLGISSPSKVFAGIGRDTAAGLIVGMDSSRKDVYRSAERLAAVPGAAHMRVGVPSGIGNSAIGVKVYIGDRELTQIVRSEVGVADATTARQVVAGRRYGGW